MKKLLNVLYVTMPEAYLGLDGETVVIRKDDTIVMRLPLHNLENIVCFSYLGASPALMGACAERNIGLCFLAPSGRFLGRISGKVRGNVLLRKEQYRVSEDAAKNAGIAVSFLIGKLTNCRKVIDRAVRDHELLLDGVKLRQASASLKNLAQTVRGCQSVEEMIGVEGSAARVYFGVFDQLILQQRVDFQFNERSRRPPLDNINAMLSFFYTILANEAVNALEAVGLDPYVGFLHQDRPGRPSLALDLMEELRPVFADRFVLSLINRKQVNGEGFTQKESGAVLMDDATRKKALSAWQDRKKEMILHPFLKEKIEFGLIPYVQALLLARHLRGDLDAYPPFFWN